MDVRNSQPEHLAMRYARTLLLLLASLIAACGHSTSPDHQRLTLRLHTGPLLAPAGDPVVLKLSLRNHGYSDIVLTGSSSCRPFGLQVRDSTGSLVAETVWSATSSRPCTADFRSWRIPARGTRVEDVWWDGKIVIEGMSRDAPPGVYELTGIVRTPAGESRSAPVVLELM
jgi:hypothetical protein